MKRIMTLVIPVFILEMLMSQAVFAAVCCRVVGGQLFSTPPGYHNAYGIPGQCSPETDWTCGDGYACGPKMYGCVSEAQLQREAERRRYNEKVDQYNREIEQKNRERERELRSKPNCGYGLEACGSQCMPAGAMCCKTYYCKSGSFCDGKGGCTKAVFNRSGR